MITPPWQNRCLTYIFSVCKVLGTKPKVKETTGALSS